MLKDFGEKGGKIKSCKLLGVTSKLDWKQSSDSTTIEFPKQKVSKYVQVLKIAMEII